MTFNDYILNPMGKSNAVLSAAAREAQRAIYSKKFDNILLRENGKIDYYLYKGKGKTPEYYAHIKVPSEVVPNFYYDVVIKFIGNTSVSANLSSLDKYDVQFYSNDPAFVYTYAYVFQKKGLFIKELASKMSRTALRVPAKEKNPENMVGYVKSLYFAYLFMKQRGLFNLLKFSGVPTIDLKSLTGNIMDADTKVRKREEEGAKVSKKRKDAVSKSDMNRMKRAGMSDQATSNFNVSTTKRVGVVKNAATNSGTKKTKSTKRF